MNQYRHLVVMLASVAALGLSVALALSLSPGEQLQHESEWVKALLQAGLIAVLGAVTSGVLEAVKDAIQQRRDESRLRFDALSDFGRMYMDVKLVRRVAQAAGQLGIDQVQDSMNVKSCSSYSRPTLTSSRAHPGCISTSAQCRSI